MAFKHFFSLLNVIIDVIASFFHCVILDYYTLPFLMLGNIRLWLTAMVGRVRRIWVELFCACVKVMGWRIAYRRVSLQ